MRILKRVNVVMLYSSGIFSFFKDRLGYNVLPEQYSLYISTAYSKHGINYQYMRDVIYKINDYEY